MKREEWIKLAIQEKLERCFVCKRWVTFEVTIENELREKKCPKCLSKRYFVQEQAEWLNKNGKTFRKDRDGLFKEIGLLATKKGLHIGFLNQRLF